MKRERADPPVGGTAWEWIVYLFPAIAAACAISGGYAMGTKNHLVIGIWSVLTLGALALTWIASRRTRKG